MSYHYQDIAAYYREQDDPPAERETWVCGRHKTEYPLGEGCDLCEVEPATFDADGEPANLAAASLDALEWLCWLKDRSQIRLRGEDGDRLIGAITRLHDFLEPHRPHRFLPPTTPEEPLRHRFPNAVIHNNELCGRCDGPLLLCEQCQDAFCEDCDRGCRCTAQEEEEAP